MKIIHLLAFQILISALIFKFTTLKFAGIYRIAAYFIFPILMILFFAVKSFYTLTVMSGLDSAPSSVFFDLLFNYVTLIYVLLSLFIQFILSYFLFNKLRNNNSEKLR